MLSIHSDRAGTYKITRQLRSILFLLTVLLPTLGFGQLSFEQMKALSNSRPVMSKASVENGWNVLQAIEGGSITFFYKLPETGELLLGTSIGKLYSVDANGQKNVVLVGETEDEAVALTGFYGMTVFKSGIYVATSKGLYRSDDSMETWKRIKNLPGGDEGILTVFSHRNTLLVTTKEGLFWTEDGLFWHETNIGSGFTPAKYIVSNGNTLLTYYGESDDSDAYISNDEGKSWKRVKLIEPTSTTAGGLYPQAQRPVASLNGKFYAGVIYVTESETAQYFIMESADGETWTKASPDISEISNNNSYIDYLSVDSDGTFYVSDQHTIYAFSPDSEGWKSIYTDKNQIWVMDLVDNELTISIVVLGEYLTYDRTNDSWTSYGITGGSAFSVVYGENNIYILSGGARSFDSTSDTGHVGQSSLYIGYRGGDWVAAKLSNPDPVIDPQAYAAIGGTEDFLAVIDQFGFVQYSTDQGQTFQSVEELSGPFRGAIAVTFYQGCIYASTDAGIYRTCQGSKWSQWEKVHDYTDGFLNNVHQFLNTGSDLYAAVSKQGLIKAQNGTDWSYDNAGINLNKTDIHTMTYDNYTQTMAIGGEGLYVRKDGVQNWTDIYPALGNLTNNGFINGIAIGGNRMFVTVNKQGVFMGYKNGTGWQRMNEGLPTQNTTFIAPFGNNLILGTENSGVYNRTMP